VLKKSNNQLIKLFLFAGVILAFLCCQFTQKQTHPTLLSGKKEIPRITLKNLFPPYKDYNYFQGSEKLSFRFNATSFDLINAWWLAEASTLAYAEEDFVKPIFKAAGLPEVEFFEHQSTQCYVAHNDKFAIVAFRGSEIWKKKDTADLNEVFSDLKTDINIWLTAWEQGGKVHRGFKKALEEIWCDLFSHIGKLNEKGCKIWMTGHSLGAALATLSAGRFDAVQGVYTFGSPRVGNEAFKENFDTKIYRFVNNSDIVPRVPPPGKYDHVGLLKFIDSKGIIRDTMIENEGPIDQPNDEPYGLQNTEPPNTNAFAGFVPAPLRDHVPFLYAIHIWNNIIKSQK